MQQNGVRWLSTITHCHTSLCCSSRSCGLQQCVAVRAIVKHIHTHPPSMCAAGRTEGACGTEAACVGLRDLQVHYLQCMDAACPLCATVSQQLNFPSHQPDNNDNNSNVLYNRQPTESPNPTEPRDPTTCGTIFTAVNNDSRSCAGCSTSSNSGWGEDEDGPDLENADHMLETRYDHMDEMLDMGLEQLEAEEEMHGMSKRGADTGVLSGSSLLGFVTSAATRQENKQLVGFGQFLLHSLLHRPGTTTVMEQEHLQEGRNLWVHLLQDCPRTTDLFAHPGCMQARRVLLHMIDCQDAGCSLCGPAKAPFASARLDPLHETARTRATDMNSWMQDLEGSLATLHV